MFTVNCIAGNPSRSPRTQQAGLRGPSPFCEVAPLQGELGAAQHQAGERPRRLSRRGNYSLELCDAAFRFAAQDQLFGTIGTGDDENVLMLLEWLEANEEG